MRSVVVALAFWAGPILAQPVGPPAVRVGDQWQWTVQPGDSATRQEREWVIRSVSPTILQGTENGAPLRLSAYLGVFDSPRTSDSNPLPLQFPLSVGQRWRYTTNWTSKIRNASGSATYDVVVIAFERIRVPAGEFDAFRVTSKADMQGVTISVKLDADIETTYWYAPAARTIVKAIINNPYVGVTTMDLISYKVQP
jgi:hypothetical protein